MLNKSAWCKKYFYIYLRHNLQKQKIVIGYKFSICQFILHISNIFCQAKLKIKIWHIFQIRHFHLYRVMVILLNCCIITYICVNRIWANGVLIQKKEKISNFFYDLSFDVCTLKSQLKRGKDDCQHWEWQFSITTWT